MTGIFELVVLLVLLYCFFNSRASTMVDVLSARMQAVYTKWETSHSTSSKKKISANTLRRFGQNELKERYLIHKENIQQSRERELFRSKDSPWNLGFPPRPARPIIGMACKACTPDSKDFSMDYASKSQDVQNILKTNTEKSDSFLIRRFSYFVHAWNLRSFDFPQVSDKVLSDHRLRGAIEEATKELVQKSAKENLKSTNSSNEGLHNQILASQEARARRILMDMRSTLSNCLLRMFTWLIFKLFPRFLTSVCLHPSQLSMLQKAASTNLPLIFVPLHRSHLDYILISFILFNIGVKAPLVAAGNNLKIPIFGWLLRGLGAFFIKRRIDPVAGRKDILYRAVLHTYMTECLSAGHNIEFYIEGGRTRTGKPCMPKGGLLSVIVGAYLDGTVEDVLLVPVSVNYDKLVDGNFVRELLGQPKQMETFSSAIKAIWTTLNSNYGSMRIDFNQPFSLRELIKSFQSMNKTGRLSQSDFFSGNESESNSPSKRNGFQKEKSFRSIPSTTSLYGTDVDEDHRVLVDKIARHLIYDCAKACAVMSTNSLAFLLLNKYRKGVPLDKLVVSFEKLKQQLLSDNRDVGFSGESIDVVKNAIELLGPDLVNLQDSSDCSEFIVTPVTKLPNVIELSYYSNALLPHFMVEGVIATSICSSIRATTPNIIVYLDEILKNALELCDILQFEFIFAKPCESLEYVISEGIDKFKYMDILYTEENHKTDFENWSHKIASSLEDSEDDEFYQYKPSPAYKIRETKEEDEKLEFFHMCLRPLIDTYAAATLTLYTLIGRQLPENDFVQEVLETIKSYLENGFCLFGESYSVEPIKNALKLFKKWNVIEMYNQDSIRIVYLTDVYNNAEEIETIVKKISYFKFYVEIGE